MLKFYTNHQRQTFPVIGIILSIFLSIQALAQTVQPDSTLPDGFPEISVSNSSNPSPGNIFMAPFGSWGMYPEQDPYITILDNYGHPIYFKRINHRNINDFKLQPNGQLTYAGGLGNKNYLMNDKMEVLDSLKPVGFWTDLHDIIVEPERTFILGIDTRLVDMSELVPGGQEDAVVMGHVVQEWDAAGNVIFEWNTWDHYNILDCQEWIDLTASVIDYAHVNTIEPDSDTSLLILARNFNEITKIDRRSGEIIWRLGGVNNEFTFTNDTIQWAWPHDIRKIGDGIFSIFDNGRFNTPPPHYSSGVIYEIDEQAKTITQLKRFRGNPDVFGDIMGNFQLLDNGHFVTGWGSGSYPDSVGITEFDEDGNIVHEIKFSGISYRAWKHQWQPNLFSASADTFDLGTLTSDTAILLDLPIQNHADYEITLTGYHLRFGHFNVLNDFPVVIPAGESATISVLFKPDLAGQFEDALTLHADNENKTQRIGRQVYLKAKAEEGFSISEHHNPKISIWPNPANDFINVTLPDKISGSWSISNLTGEIIKTNNFSGASELGIGLSELTPGIYILDIKSTENYSYKSKFIIY
jgi:hypothetical protein